VRYARLHLSAAARTATSRARTPPASSVYASPASESREPRLAVIRAAATAPAPSLPLAPLSAFRNPPVLSPPPQRAPAPPPLALRLAELPAGAQLADVARLLVPFIGAYGLVWTGDTAALLIMASPEAWTLARDVLPLRMPAAAGRHGHRRPGGGSGGTAGDLVVTKMGSGRLDEAAAAAAAAIAAAARRRGNRKGTPIRRSPGGGAEVAEVASTAPSSSSAATLHSISPSPLLSTSPDEPEPVLPLALWPRAFPNFDAVPQLYPRPGGDEGADDSDGGREEQASAAAEGTSAAAVSGPLLHAPAPAPSAGNVFSALQGSEGEESEEDAEGSGGRGAAAAKKKRRRKPKQKRKGAHADVAGDVPAPTPLAPETRPVDAQWAGVW